MIKSSRGRFCQQAISLLAVFIFFIVPVFCQTPELELIKSNFVDYSRQNLQEKIFLHTDKAFYVAGEVLWFRLFDVESEHNTPIDLSKVAYIEVINKDQKAVLQAKVALHEGKGNGSFFLPLSFSSGNYKIRAYTNWMKNFSADYFFEKNLTILNPLKKLGPVTTVNNGFDIQFFPEGGNQVTGIQSRVGFRITDKSGKGVDCTGSIVDQDNKSAAEFRTLKFGIGRFLFTPENGHSYKALVRTGSNNALVAELPEVHDHGYTLQIDKGTDGQLNVSVNSDDRSKDKRIYLLAHTRQVVKSANLLLVKNGAASVSIPMQDIGDGISHFTLFDEDKRPVCERLYFKRPSQVLQISAKTEFDEYGSRKKIYLDILAKDEKNQPAIADMSMSVFLADSLQSVDESDISSYLWLTSDLKGNVESPGYYFKNTGAIADEALDNVMLTHGWRRFKWEEVLHPAPAAFEFLPEYEGHIITGKITDKRTGKPVENIPVYVTVPGEHFELGGSVSNAKGKIQFDLRRFYAASEVIVEAGNKKEDSIYRVDMLSPFSEKFSEAPFPAFSFSENLQVPLAAHSIYSQVQNTYLNDNLLKFDEPAEMLDSSAFYGRPDRKYFLDDYTRFGTMEEVLREYVSGILVKKQQGKFHIQMMDESWHNFFDDDPLVLLDGVPIFDINKIIEMDPFKVKKIELRNRQYILGPIISDGIISYSTYKGDLSGFQLDANAVILEYDGLQLQREFYAPLYDTPREVASRMPDFRNVLYWSPEIKTDEHGKKQLNFFSSDQKGKYVAVIQGITSNGRTGSQVISFEVNK